MMTYGACIIGVGATEISQEEKTFFREAKPFGFILFARNIDTPEQVATLCAALRDAAGHNATILIDQEGGRVQRLRPPHWRDWPAPMNEVANTGENAVDAMYIRYRIIAHELHSLGIDANCAPLVDVAGPSTHEFLKNRCYAQDAHTVTSIGNAVASGLLDGGVLPVVKHMPGHGRATVDSHFDLPVVDAPLDELSDTDFAPFRALNTLPMGMTAHLLYDACDKAPATLSAPVMNLIREQIGFQGLIMTDDISMKALKGDLATLCTQSIEAGCDVILHCNGNIIEARQVADAAGMLSGKSLSRAHHALNARQTPNEVDIPALEAKLSQLRKS